MGNILLWLFALLCMTGSLLLNSVDNLTRRQEHALDLEFRAKAELDPYLYPNDYKNNPEYQSRYSKIHKGAPPAIWPLFAFLGVVPTLIFKLRVQDDRSQLH